MLMTFDKTSGPATGHCQPGRSHMRGDGGNTPRNSIQLRADPPRLLVPVAPSRVEETTVHPFIQFSRDIAFVLAGSLFLVALGVVAAIVWALVSGPK